MSKRLVFLRFFSNFYGFVVRCHRVKNPITLATVSSWNLCGGFLLGTWIGKRRGAVTRGEEPHHTGRFYIALYFVIILTTTNLYIISYTLYLNLDD